MAGRTWQENDGRHELLVGEIVVGDTEWFEDAWYGGAQFGRGRLAIKAAATLAEAKERVEHALKMLQLEACGRGF